MKKAIFMYLFLFAVLLIVFMYMNQKRIFENKDKKIEKLEQKIVVVQDSLQIQLQENVNLNYFGLKGNDSAMTYFENLGFEATEIEEMVRDEIYDKNSSSANNPLITFEGVAGTMKINKLKFLNHKWIIADFSDGQLWGEVLIEFFVADNKKVSYTVLSSLLYPQN